MVIQAQGLLWFLVKGRLTGRPIKHQRNSPWRIPMQLLLGGDQVRMPGFLRRKGDQRPGWDWESIHSPSRSAAILQEL